MRHFFVIVALGEIFYGIVLGQSTFYEGQNPNGGHFPPGRPEEEVDKNEYEDGIQLSYFRDDSHLLEPSEETQFEGYLDKNQKKLSSRNNPYQIEDVNNFVQFSFPIPTSNYREKTPIPSSDNRASRKKRSDDSGWGWGGWGNWHAAKTTETTTTTTTTTKQPIVVQNQVNTRIPRVRNGPKGKRRRKGTRRPKNVPEGQNLNPQNGDTDPPNFAGENAPVPKVPNEYPGFTFPRNFLKDMLSGLNSKLPVLQTKASTPKPSAAAVPPGIPNDFPKLHYPKGFFNDMLSGLNSTLPPIQSPEDSNKAPENPLSPEADRPRPPSSRMRPTPRGRPRKRRPGSGRPRRRRPKFRPHPIVDGVPGRHTTEPNNEFAFPGSKTSPEMKIDSIGTAPPTGMETTEIIEEDSSEYDTTGYSDTDQKVSSEEDLDYSSLYPNKNYSLNAGPATFSRPKEIYETLMTPEMNKTIKNFVFKINKNHPRKISRKRGKHHPRQNKFDSRHRIKHHRRPLGRNDNDTISHKPKIRRQRIKGQNAYEKYIEYEINLKNLSEKPDSYSFDEPDKDYSQIIGSAQKPEDSEYNSSRPKPDELLKASNDYSNDSYPDDEMEESMGFNKIYNNLLSFIKSAFGSSLTTPSPNTPSPGLLKPSDENMEQSTASNTTYPSVSLDDLLSYIRSAFGYSLTTPSQPTSDSEVLKPWNEYSNDNYPDEDVEKSTGSNTAYSYDPLDDLLSYIRSELGSSSTTSSPPASTYEESNGVYDEAEDRMDEPSKQFEMTLKTGSDMQTTTEMTSYQTPSSSQELSTTTPTEFIAIDVSTVSLARKMTPENALPISNSPTTLQPVQTTTFMSILDDVDVLSPTIESDNGDNSTNSLLDYFRNLFGGLRNNSYNSSLSDINKTIEEIVEKEGSKNDTELRRRNKFLKKRKMRRRKKGRLHKRPNNTNVPTESINTSYDEPDTSSFNKYLSNILSNLWPKDSSSSITELISTEVPYTSTLQQSTLLVTQSSTIEKQKALPTTEIPLTPSTSADMTSTSILMPSSTKIFSTSKNTFSTSPEGIYTATGVYNEAPSTSTYTPIISIVTPSSFSEIPPISTLMFSTSTEALISTPAEIMSTSTSETSSISTEKMSSTSAGDISSTSTEKMSSAFTEIPSTVTEMPLTTMKISATPTISLASTEIISSSTEMFSTSMEPLSSTEIPFTPSETSTGSAAESTAITFSSSGTSTGNTEESTAITSKSTKFYSTSPEINVSTTSTSTIEISSTTQIPSITSETISRSETPPTYSEISSTSSQADIDSTRTSFLSTEISLISTQTSITSQNSLTSTETWLTSTESPSTLSASDLSSTQSGISSTAVTTTTEMLLSSTESLTTSSDIPSAATGVSLSSTENLLSSTETPVTKILIEVTSAEPISISTETLASFPQSSVSSTMLSSTSELPSTLTEPIHTTSEKEIYSVSDAFSIYLDTTTVSESVTPNHEISTASEDNKPETSADIISSIHDTITTEMESTKEENVSQKTTTALLLSTNGETTEMPKMSGNSQSDLSDEEEAESLPVIAIPPPGVKCKVNETYYSCVPHCQHTCFNFDSDVPCLPNFCEPGCFCSPGLVIDENENCVEVKDCYQQACAIDEEWWDCTPECHNTCVNYARAKACQDTDCTSGCFCREGLIRDVDGSCVDPEECEEPVCEDHEEHTDCMSPCNTCTANCHICPFLMCRSGCDCRDGFKRNDKGDCILASKCPKCDDPYPDSTNSTEVN